MDGEKLLEEMELTESAPQESVGNADNQDKATGRPKFTVNDFLQYKENGPVIRTFVIFALCLAIGPIFAFFAFQRLAVSLKIPRVVDGSVVGLIGANAVVVSLIGAYAWLAYQEEKRDYFAQENKKSASAEGLSLAASEKKLE